MEQDYILVASTGDASLPEAQSDFSGSAALPAALQPLYDSFRNSAAGEYTMGLGAGVDDIPFGPVNITVDNTRISVVSDEENERDLIILQGYAQATLFDRFYVSGILIGDAVPVDTSNIIDLVDHLSRTEEEREDILYNNAAKLFKI